MWPPFLLLKIKIIKETVKNLESFAGSFIESAVSLSFLNTQNHKFFDSDFIFIFLKKYNLQFFCFNIFKNWNQEKSKWPQNTP